MHTQPATISYSWCLLSVSNLPVCTISNFSWIFFLDIFPYPIKKAHIYPFESLLNKDLDKHHKLPSRHSFRSPHGNEKNCMKLLKVTPFLGKFPSERKEQNVFLMQDNFRHFVNVNSYHYQFIGQENKCSINWALISVVGIRPAVMGIQSNIIKLESSRSHQSAPWGFKDDRNVRFAVAWSPTDFKPHSSVYRVEPQWYKVIFHLPPSFWALTDLPHQNTLYSNENLLKSYH